LTIIVRYRNYCKVITHHYRQKSVRQKYIAPSSGHILKTITPSELDLKLNGSIKT